MEPREALAQLEAAGTERNRAIYGRHGAGENQYGVAFKDLRTMAKRIGHDHNLAGSLWATGNADARLLACMVADPGRMSEEDLDAWIGGISYYVLVDEFVSSVASQVPGLRARTERWMKSARDWTAQAGWDLAGVLAARDSSLRDEFFLDLLEKIEREIDHAGNRTRHAMNGTLIAIALRNENLRREAVDIARRIGPVVVDHGETGCVTPAAIPYIEKTVAYRRAQAAKKAAKTTKSAKGTKARAAAGAR
ncbi:MAG: DNA alkylation repair protein [Candidatus Limnocylindria bacterium]